MKMLHILRRISDPAQEVDICIGSLEKYATEVASKLKSPLMPEA